MLTRLEIEALRLRQRGLTVKEGAAVLRISPSAMDKRLRRVRKKTGARSILEAIWKLRPARCRGCRFAPLH